MGSRLAIQILAVIALGLGACSSDDDPIASGSSKGAVAGAAGYAGWGSTAAGGTDGSTLPVLGFAGFGTGRDAMGACPSPPNVVCTGSFMEYFFCLSAQCATAYNECYGTNGYCLSAMGCVSGCTCGDAACEQGCYPKDCMECLQRLNDCGSKSTCAPMVCTTQGSAGASGTGEQGGAAGQSAGSSGAGGHTAVASAGTAGRG